MIQLVVQRDFLAEGVHLFNTGDFWHAHEAWEQAWLQCQEPQKTFYKGIIQAAAALVHWQRGNLVGLHRNWYKARPRLVAIASFSNELDIYEFIRSMDRFVLSDGRTNNAPHLSYTDMSNVH